MTASTALPSVLDIESFMTEYYCAWSGTDEDRIMSYYAENVTVQIPGILMQGKAAVREQFVRPFIIGFPGNRHIIKNMIFGRESVVVEFSFDAQHKGAFAGRAATDARVEVAGCGVYEYDSAKRQITAARIYFDVRALLAQISDPLYPRPTTEEPASSPAFTIAAPVEHLDVATVIAVSQTISGEVVLEKLLDTLLRTAIEHAGAERALLVLSRKAEERIAAEATRSGDAVKVSLRDEPMAGTLLPETIFRYVLRTRESVVLDEAGIPNPFSTDSYIAQQQPRSVFCLPLMHQAKWVGALYLENKLAPGVFAPARTAVLKLLASQAAIALENSRLCRDLADREARIRRLWDSNILGFCTWNLDGAVVSANEEFLRMLQYNRDDLVSGQLRWTELTPADWREQDERAVTELRSTGTFLPVEKEYFRKDGSRVPVLIGGALFEGSGKEGVAYVLDLSERKGAEKASRESEQRFRDYAETASDWFWEIGPDYKFTRLTENAFGSSPKQRIGTVCWDHALDLEMEPEKWRLFQETLAARKPFRDFVYHGVGGNGPMYVKASGKPVFDSNGDFLGYRGTGSDVTAIIRAQEALRESERSFRLALDGIPGLVAILAPDGGVEVVNRQILDYSGQSLEELRNWGTNGTVHPEDLPYLADTFGRSIASGIPYQIEFRLRRFDGEYRWFDNRGVPFRDESGRILRWHVLLTDINERKRAEEALKAREAELRRANQYLTVAQELSQTGSYARDVSTDEQTLSEQMYRIFDFDPAKKVTHEMVIGRIHPEDLPAFERAQQLAVEAGKDFEMTYRIVTGGGRVKHLHSFSRRLAEFADRLVYIGATQDVTEVKLGEAALSAARSELTRAARVMTLGALTASIAHEVNQPLSGIITNANTCLRMLGADPPNLDGARATAQRTLRDGNRASEIIQRLRAMFAHKERTAERVDLNEAAREVLALSFSELQRAAIILRTDYEENLSAITGDRVQLQQVILNLVLNAADAMRNVEDRPRDLFIATAHEDGKRIRLSVRDSGSGIDSKNVGKLFEAFFTTKSNGMGIGLSISRSIIESHEGRIWATNNDGPGATFSFSIPTAQNVGQPAHTP